MSHVDQIRLICSAASTFGSRWQERTKMAARILLGCCAMIALTVQACQTNFDCSLNGVCLSSKCVCDSPWTGAACQTSQYAVTPASGKNLWTGDSRLNTWNGPIINGADGTFHLFDPVYQHGSLWNVMYYAHGTVKNAFVVVCGVVTMRMN